VFGFGVGNGSVGGLLELEWPQVRFDSTRENLPGPEISKVNFTWGEIWVLLGEV
jgi:hypothetical protein